MTNYAIIDEKTREFYPDPIYTDTNRATAKIVYLTNYREQNGMKPLKYIIEELSPERFALHEKEWNNFTNLLD